MPTEAPCQADVARHQNPFVHCVYFLDIISPETNKADIIISNADGRKTIMDMLEGRYINERIRKYCVEPQDETNWAVHIFLGVRCKEKYRILLLFSLIVFLVLFAGCGRASHPVPERLPEQAAPYSPGSRFWVPASASSL